MSKAASGILARAKLPETRTAVAADVTGSVDAAGAKPRAARRRRRTDQLQPVQAAQLKRGSLLQLIAVLLFVPQAGLMAFAVHQLAIKQPVTQLLLIVAAIFVLGLLRTALQASGERMAFKASRQALSQLRGAALAALAVGSPLDRNRPASGQAASIIAEQAEMAAVYWSRYQPVQLRVMVVPPILLLFVFWYSWAAALVLLVAAPLIPLFMALIGYRAKAASEQQLVEMGQMNGFLLDRLRGLATIRSFHAVDLTAQRLRNNAETLRHKTMIVLRIAFLSSAVLELFSALGVAMVAVYIGFHLLGQLNFGSWGEMLTLGQGLFILLLAPSFFEPLRELSAVWHDRAAGEAAIDALETMSKTTLPLTAAPQSSAPTDPYIASASAQSQPALRLDRVDFAYDGKAQSGLLQDFSLTVAEGEHLALLAPSGTGKSTILALMAGLVAPGAGTVFVQGQPLDQDSAAQLRRQFSWIGQQPHIFSGSVQANITLGRAGYDQAAVKTALASAALDQTIAAATHRDLGEQGTGLSGGEGLRLALARAALKRDAQILFADEPTAHLDRETAASVSAGLLELARHKTLIIATHDEELAQKMTRIIRLVIIDGRLQIAEDSGCETAVATKPASRSNKDAQ